MQHKLSFADNTIDTSAIPHTIAMKAPLLGRAQHGRSIEVTIDAVGPEVDELEPPAILDSVGIWMDWFCLPQSNPPRTVRQENYFRRMLEEGLNTLLVRYPTILAWEPEKIPGCDLSCGDEVSSLFVLHGVTRCTPKLP